MQNQVVQVLKPFLLFMHSFQKTKTHNMFVRDVKPSLQWFGIGHLVCWHIENITNYTWVWPSNIYFVLYFCIQHFKPKWCKCMKILKSQVFMITWKLMKRWHPQCWKNNLIILRWRRSIRMVEGAWNTIFICWFCSLTNFRDYWFPNWSNESF